MAAKAGAAPWSTGFKRSTRADQKKHGVEWSFSSGYRQKSEWDKSPKKPKTKTVRLYNGRTVEVPDADFEDFIGHFASPPSDPYSEVGKYIDKAFENLDRVQEVEGCGHIVLIEYVPTYQILRVEFATDGAVVVFFRVPKEVYSELYYLANTKQTAISAVDGTQRHVLGMRFWDIIRIRGQREGSRYRYEYVIEGERRGSAFEQAMEKEREAIKSSGTIAAKEADKEDLEMYDRMAKNMLTGSQLTAYNKLETLKQKENYLHKAGIIDI